MLEISEKLMHHNAINTVLRNQISGTVPRVYTQSLDMSWILGLLNYGIQQKTGKQFYVLQYTGHRISNQESYSNLIQREPQKITDINGELCDIICCQIIQTERVVIDKRDLPTYNRALDAALTTNPRDFIRSHVKDANTINVITDQSNIAKTVLRVAALIPTLLHGCLIPEEMKPIFESVSFWDADKTAHLIDEYLNKYGNEILNSQRRKILEETLGTIGDYIVGNARNQLQRVEEHYRETIQRLEIIQKDKERLSLVVLGINQQSIDTSQMIEELLNIKSIQSIEKADRINLIIETFGPATYNRDAAVSLYEARSRNNLGVSDGLSEAFRRVFVEQEYELYFRTYFNFNLQEGSVHYFSGKESKEDLGTPNPHLQGYDCWGDNPTAIRESVLNTRDYTYAISLACASTMDFNLYDGTVFGTYFEQVLQSHFQNRVKCLYNKETNQWLSWRELIQS